MKVTTQWWKSNARHGLYDFRRLVVFASENETRSPIWQPLLGHAGIFRGGVVILQEARAVNCRELNLPPNLLDRFFEWGRNLSEIGRTRSIHPHEREKHKQEGALLARELAELVGEKFQVEFEGEQSCQGPNHPKSPKSFFMEKIRRFAQLLGFYVP
jgi:hypothetical protein